MLLLAAQSFAGGAVVRGLGGHRLRDVASLPRTLFLLVAERKVCVQQGEGEGRGRPKWFDRGHLERLGFSLAADGDQLAYGHSLAAPLYYLGAPSDGAGSFVLAADVHALAGAGELHALLGQEGLALADLRSVIMMMPPAELAVAGHAVALSQWHWAHQFCPRCGAKTAAVAGGAKRQCGAAEAHTLYPRTDPVVIMLVESPDGSKVLLGRSKKAPPFTLTCLAGFVDQGESIEEAVAREVREEAGVAVDSVTIVGSQPWPLGRGGSHELMIGCLARAATEILRVDPEEMEECRWVSRAELEQALQNSTSPGSPYVGGGRRGGGEGEEGRRKEFFVPPPIAIAHGLMKGWVEQTTQAPQHCNM